MYINVEGALVLGLRSSGQHVDAAKNPLIVAPVFPRETCNALNMTWGFYHPTLNYELTAITVDQEVIVLCAQE